MSNTRGPEWRGWEPILQPGEIVWEPDGKMVGLENCLIAGRIVASIMPRPSYCDRGHYIIDCAVPDLDAADHFPRYYMSEAVAKSETELFLRWRLWKKRG